MKNGSAERRAAILLVEDDPDDAYLITHGLDDWEVPHSITVVEDGQEALDYLLDKRRRGARPLPDLVLLDLNLPKVSGHEVLRRVKQDDRLRRLPVVVLTTSKADEDILRSYDDYANTYISKPSGLSETKQMLDTLTQFWFSLATLPHIDPGGPS